VLVVHGGPGFDHTYLRPWLDPLGEGARVVFVDLRSHGQSRREPHETFRTATVVADLEALRQGLGLDRWVLLGHSFGGFMALSYAVQHPERVASLVLVTTAADIWSLGDTGRRLRQAGGDGLLRAWRTLTFDDAEFWAARRAILPFMFATPDRARAAAVFAGVRPSAGPNAFWFKREAARYDVRPQLADLRMPALVMTGQYDLFVPPAAGESLASALPNGRLRRLAHSGHLPFVEEQGTFIEAVRAHLRDEPYL
jgi:proline iminopeptidase